MNPTDDQQDVARVLAGDTSAFEGIVRRWQSPLINLAYRFCRDRGRSEEMAQEAFLRAFRNLKSWRQESAFSTWLFSLATNLYCSEVRRIPPVTLPFDEVPEPHDPRALDAGLQQRSEEAAPPPSRQHAAPQIPRSAAAVLLSGDGRPRHRQQPQHPEGTVKARLFRARDMLRAKLQPRINLRPSLSTKESI